MPNRYTREPLGPYATNATKWDPTPPSRRHVPSAEAQHVAAIPTTMQPFAPPKPAEQPSPSAWDYARTAARGVSLIPGEAASVYIGAAQGREGAATPDSFDAFVRKHREWANNYQRTVQERIGDGLGGEVLSSIPNIGFSLAALPVAAAGKAVGTALGAPLGKGAAVTGIAASIAATNAVMQRATEFRFALDMLEAENYERSVRGEPEMNAAEALEFVRGFEEELIATGKWQARTESINSVLQLLLLSRIPAGNILGRSAQAVLGTAGFELPTEIVTEIGQSQALQGTPLEPERELSFRSWRDIKESARAVAPGVFTTSLAMGGVGAVYGRTAQTRELTRRMEAYGVDPSQVPRKEFRKRFDTLLAVKQLDPTFDLGKAEAMHYMRTGVFPGQEGLARERAQAAQAAQAPEEASRPQKTFEFDTDPQTGKVTVESLLSHSPEALHNAPIETFAPVNKQVLVDATRQTAEMLGVELTAEDTQTKEKVIRRLRELLRDSLPYDPETQGGLFAQRAEETAVVEPEQLSLPLEAPQAEPQQAERTFAFEKSTPEALLQHSPETLFNAPAEAYAAVTKETLVAAVQQLAEQQGVELSADATQTKEKAIRTLKELVRDALPYDPATQTELFAPPDQRTEVSQELQEAQQLPLPFPEPVLSENLVDTPVETLAVTPLEKFANRTFEELKKTAAELQNRVDPDRSVYGEDTVKFRSKAEAVRQIKEWARQLQEETARQVVESPGEVLEPVVDGPGPPKYTIERFGKKFAVRVGEGENSILAQTGMTKKQAEAFIAQYAQTYEDATTEGTPVVREIRETAESTDDSQKPRTPKEISLQRAADSWVAQAEAGSDAHAVRSFVARTNKNPAVKDLMAGLELTRDEARALLREHGKAALDTAITAAWQAQETSGNAAAVRSAVVNTKKNPTIKHLMESLNVSRAEAQSLLENHGRESLRAALDRKAPTTPAQPKYRMVSRGKLVKETATGLPISKEAQELVQDLLPKKIQDPVAAAKAARAQLLEGYSTDGVTIDRTNLIALEADALLKRMEEPGSPYTVETRPLTMLEELPLAEGTNIREAVMTPEQKALADNISNLTGRQVVFFTSDAPVPFAGVVLPNDPNTLYVSANANQTPAAFITGHELWHTMDRELRRTEAGRALIKALNAELRSMSRETRKGMLLEAVGDRKVDGLVGGEELRAEVFGMYVQHPKFMTEALNAANTPARTAMSLWETVIEFLDNLLISGTAYAQYHAEINQARQNMALQFGQHILQKDPNFQTTLDEARFRMKKQLDVDGTMRPTRNSKGQALHHTEEGVRNFWRWFGDSKTVDKKGQPIVFYHGTKHDLTAFSPDRIGSEHDSGWFGHGYYFAASPEIAGSYIDYYGSFEPQHHLAGYGQQILPAYLKIDSPLHVNTSVGLSMDQAESMRFTEEARARGYDGVAVYPEGLAKGGTESEAIVFDNRQIKSALGNTGDFSLWNEDLRYRVNADYFLENAGSVAAGINRKLESGIQAVKDLAKEVKTKKGREVWKQELLAKEIGLLPIHDLFDLHSKDHPWLNDYRDLFIKDQRERQHWLERVQPMVHKLEGKLHKYKKPVGQMAITNSLLQMTPWLPADKQGWVPANMRNKAEVSTADKLAAAQKAWVEDKMPSKTGYDTFLAAYEAGQKEYRAIGSTEAKTEYQNIAKLMREIHREQRRATEKRISEIAGDDAEALRVLRRTLLPEGELRGAYWPLNREGRFGLSIKRKGSTDVKDWSFQAFESAAEARAALAAAEASDVKGEFEITTFDKGHANFHRNPVPRDFVNNLTQEMQDRLSQLGVDQMDIDSLVSYAVQAYLRSQPEMSALKNAMRRKGVAGANEERALNTAAAYIARNANRLAMAKYGRDMEVMLRQQLRLLNEKASAKGEFISPMDRALLDSLQARMAAGKDNTTYAITRTATKLASMWYMFSPSAYVVQASQPWATTLPRLMVEYGSGSAIKHLTTAYKSALFDADFTLTNLAMDPAKAPADLRAALELYEDIRSFENHLPRGRTQTKEKLQARINQLTPKQRDALAMKFAVDKGVMEAVMVNEVIDIAGNRRGTGVHSSSLYFMRKGEEHSRVAGFLAAFRAATEKGKSFQVAVSEAADIARTSLYDYSKEAKPVLMQNAWVRTATQFQYFSYSVAARTYVLLRRGLLNFNAVTPEQKAERSKAIWELNYLAGTTAILGGMLGGVPTSLVLALIQFFSDNDDEPREIRAEMADRVESLPGGMVLSRGILGALGADMSRRLGIADVFRLGDPDPAGLHGGNKLDYMMTSAAGPFYSAARDFARGYDMITRQGRWLDGSIAAMPKAPKDFLKAIKLATQGAQTGAGKVVLEPENITIVDIALQLGGVAPARVNAVLGRERAIKNINTRITERRSSLVREVLRALESGNPRQVERAIDRVEEFNKKMPMFALNKTDFKTAATAYLRKEAGIHAGRELRIRSHYGFTMDQD